VRSEKNEEGREYAKRPQCQQRNKRQKDIHSHPNDAYTFQHRVPEYSTSRKATLAMDMEERRERKDEL
jgi:hypothetical protein